MYHYQTLVFDKIKPLHLSIMTSPELFLHSLGLLINVCKDNPFIGIHTLGRSYDLPIIPRYTSECSPCVFPRTRPPKHSRSLPLFFSRFTVSTYRHPPGMELPKSGKKNNILLIIFIPLEDPRSLTYRIP